jgi:D-3-phosphoglycerate dehydrogenase
MSRVAITDYTFDSLAIEESILKPLGAEIVAWKERRPPGELATLVADADQVITQFAPITAEVIGAMRRARVIVRYGIGVDNVDLAAARQKGIPVCNVPDYCIDEVADQTLAFILAGTRHVLASCLHVRAGKWGLAVPLEAMKCLRDLTVGIVGFGRIGRAVAQRLEPFGCRRLVSDPLVPAETIRSCGAAPADLETLLRESDVVTLHCPATAETRGLIDRRAIARMKPGAILVNVGRGTLVDPAALEEAMASGRLGFAALDVFDPEPIPLACPLLRHDDVVVSSHIASASARAVRRLRESAAGIAARSIRGEPLPNVVNAV